MTVAAGLIASRFIHFTALAFLFGAALFPLYSFREGERSPFRATLAGRLRTPLLIAAIVALISGVSWLSFTSASMSGTPSGATDIGIIRTVIQETEFGRVWIWRLGLAAILVLLFIPKGTGEALSLARIGASTLLLTSIGGTGHAGADTSSWGTVHVANDSLHLLAAGAWLGGLVPLVIALSGNVPEATPAKVKLLRQFSTMGMFAVAALVASGLVNSWFQVESLQALLVTPYGRWLLFKIALFLGMLGLAYANRNRLVPALAAMREQPEPYLNKLRRNVLGEQALGLLVLAVVALIGTLEPAHLQAE